jgi:NADH-quinone oxidoreductase subunit H
VEAEGLATSAQKIELTLTDSLEALFCGRGERALHTTFRGDVEVAFPAVVQGAPPVAAEVHEVVLDLRPPVPTRSVTDARRAEAERALAFLGLTVDPTPVPSGGLAVAMVGAGSRAEAAGIAAGDVVTAFDGVHVGAIEDMIPSGARARVTIGVRRDGVEAARELPTLGLRIDAPRELAAAALVIGLATALVLLILAPSVGTSAWLEERTARQLFARSLARSLAEAARAFDPPKISRTGVIAAACASLLFAVMPFGRYVVLADLDIAILLAVTLAALTTIGALTGGARSALQITSFLVSAALAIAAVVALAGSPRLDDIVRAQGAAPWEWFALRSPVTLVLFVVHLAAALAQTSLEPPALAEADADPRRIHRGPGVRRVAIAAEWACVVVTCGTSAALFLGGWQLPGVSLGQQHGELRLEFVGSVVFLAKAAALLALAVGVRRVVPVLAIRHTMRVCWRWLIPLAALGLVATLGELAWPLGHVAMRALTYGTCALVAFAIARFAYRVRLVARVGSAAVRVDPFI